MENPLTVKNSLYSTILLFLSITVALSHFNIAHATASSWDVMRSQFKLNHHLNRPEVQTQRQWLLAHPSYINLLTKRCEPYIYHIINELKKRNLPAEIALIPMLESAYDPLAYSGSGAAGLWQFMPATGQTLGLKQDWWYDGRKGIGPSTDAALNYLSRLNQFFAGDWLLAIAAYDSGEGTVANAIKNSGQSGKNIDFWSLPISRETKVYIPRLLALAEMLNNPNRYHLNLPYLAHTPYFEEVNVGSQIQLSHAAKLAGISYNDLKKLNPQFTRQATAPNHPFKLLIPSAKVDDFMRRLALIPSNERMDITKHQVTSGDNLQTIAKQYNTSQSLIKELNALKSNSIKKNDFVLIPSNNKNKAIQQKNAQASQRVTKSVNKTTQYTVRKGDNILLIAKRLGIKAHDITRWNHLNKRSQIKIGQHLLIQQKPLNKKAIPHDKHRSYTIKPGDNFSKIAKHFALKTRSIKALNPQVNERKLRPGMVIQLG